MSFKENLIIFSVSSAVFFLTAFFLSSQETQEGKVLGIIDIIEKNIDSESQGSKMTEDAELLKQKIESQVCQHFDSVYFNWEKEWSQLKKEVIYVQEEKQAQSRSSNSLCCSFYCLPWSLSS